MSEFSFYINSYGVSTTAGNSSIDTAKSYYGRKTYLKRNPNYIGVDGLAQVMANIWPIQKFEKYVTRLNSLFVEAFNDCESKIKNKIDLNQKYALYLVLPKIFYFSPEGTLQNHYDNFRSVIPKYISEIYFRLDDHAGGISAINDVINDLMNQKYSGVYVCSLDSYIDPNILSLCQAQNQLISKKNPYGYVPGEAGAALFLTRAKRKPANILGEILTTSVSTEEEKLNDLDRAPLGKGLQFCFNELASRTPETWNPDFIFTDLNGERYRAEEFGYAACAVQRFTKAFSNIRYISSTFGDVGAASGLLLIVVALHYPLLNNWDFNKPFSFIVSTSSKDGLRSVVAVNATL